MEPKIQEKVWDPKIESDIRKKWEDSKLYEFHPDTDGYTIDTPPPYPSGRPWHIGAAAHYAQIDMIARTARMNGKNVYFPIGIDRNGLPVELYTEKKHGIRMRETERGKFLDLCKDALDDLEAEMILIMKNLGLSCDFDNYYRTDSKEYRALTQATFIELWKNDSIYLATRPYNNDWVTGTTIADAEIIYEELPTKLVHMKFKTNDGEVIIASTRPELLCACKAVIVNPEDVRYTDLIGTKVTVPISNQEVEIQAHHSAQIEFGSGAVQEMHRRWFEKHLKDFNVIYKNRSDDFHGLALSGPKSRDLLQKLVRENISNENFKFRDVREMYVAGVPAIVNRISFTGELGYEVYVAPHFQLKLYEEMEAAGKDFNLKPFGSRALMSMRLEKNWGAWTLDFRPDFTAKESGLDFFIDWNKNFIGKESAKKDNSKLKLTPLIIETDDIDVTNNEAVVKDGKSIGYITSGGFAHHVKKSIAYSYLDEEILKTNEKFQVEINGNFYNSTIIKEPLYDPRGTKMRS